jgi:hypothetical protein
MFRLDHGVFVVRTWYQQPLFSHGLIAAGGVVILVALLPSNWIRLVTRPAAR